MSIRVKFQPSASPSTDEHFDLLKMLEVFIMASLKLVLILAFLIIWYSFFTKDRWIDNCG